jgi:hypothetical protein
MRAIVLASVLALAACEPSIASGSYQCGPEQLCPEGFACNGVDGLCVAPGAAKPFVCGAEYGDVAGDDSPATARTLGELACVSFVSESRSCLPMGDTGDFYTFKVADGCTSSEVHASVLYPIAWQHLVLQLGKLGETPVTIESKCPTVRDVDDPLTASCLAAPVQPGTYVLGVIADGTGDCDGTCKFNRYTLGVQLATP